jgi:hypothetical protein
MDSNLIHIKREVYDRCQFQFSHFEKETESEEYDACSYSINGRIIKSRNAKATPIKIGQFVTCWKRINDGTIAPFDATDKLDLLVVTTLSQGRLGQFVFPKSVLKHMGIITTSAKEGKRAFRVYPPWDVVNSKQAERTQQWQIHYFTEINDHIDMERVKQLYSSV